MKAALKRLALGALLVFAVSAAGWASECPDDRRLMAERLRELPAFYSIFAGRVTRVTEVAKWTYETELVMTKSWRGVETARITVRSNTYFLGPVFELGQEYLVFAHPTGAAWLDPQGCGYTLKLADAEPWLKVLGKPRYVAHAAGNEPPR